MKTSEGVFECSARGKFRKDKITPYAGDDVTIEEESSLRGVIVDIKKRRNYLIRPPVANINTLFIVVSLKSPSPNIPIIDKTIAAVELRDIEPVLILTKQDLSDTKEQKEFLYNTYTKAGIKSYCISSITGKGVEKIKELLPGKISAFTGNSGVGKTTLLNAIFPGLQLKTGEISNKLGRGKHTTREVELYPVSGGGYVADTPGFSTFDIERYDITEKESLIYGFREFLPYYGKCKFSTCTHTGEKGCEIGQAVTDGSISKSRYKSYLEMYQEIKDRKPWMANKNV